jgi:hypothetical protein
MEVAPQKFIGSYNLKVHNLDLGERPFELIDAIQFESSTGRVITVPSGYRNRLRERAAVFSSHRFAGRAAREGSNRSRLALR